MAVLDLEKIKSGGLEVDFLKYTKEGFEAIRPDDHYRLKTYGLCAQRHEGYFMMRIRIPGGAMNSAQMECIADLAERYGHGWGHLTTRGNIELHSVKINDFFVIQDALKRVKITTRSSCGHTFRNIMGCHLNGVCPEQPFDLYPWIQKIHDHVLERAEHYNRRLPRRLNVSFSGCPGCGSDARINDIGFVAKKREEGGGTAYGFELWVGGSLGTNPRMGFLLKEFVPMDEVLPSLDAITEIYCLFGERKMPAKARLKFLIEGWGIEKFKTEFEQKIREFKEKQNALPKELLHPGLFEPAASWEAIRETEGIRAQRQEGFYRLEFWAPLGELKAGQMKTIAALSKKYADGKIHHTARQNFEFHNVREESIDDALHEMRRVGLGPENSNSVLNVVSCPGTSFCSLAVTSSQGAASVLMKEFGVLSFQRDAALKDIQISISGCPNSCAKHQVADIGLAGGMTEAGGIRRFGYQLYVGGRFNGNVRCGVILKKGIPDDLVFPTVDSLFEIFKEGRLNGEKFPSFTDRLGQENLSRLLEERLSMKRPTAMQFPIDMLPQSAEILFEDDKDGGIGDVKEWDLKPLKQVHIDGEAVAMAKTNEGFFACQNTCPHAGGSLSKGTAEGHVITCPSHGWQFDLKTGACLTEPGNDIKIYPVHVKANDVLQEAAQ